MSLRDDGEFEKLAKGIRSCGIVSQKAAPKLNKATT
jgi:hypothetical protein